MTDKNMNVKNVEHTEFLNDLFENDPDSNVLTYLPCFIHTTEPEVIYYIESILDFSSKFFDAETLQEFSQAKKEGYKYICFYN